MPVGNGNLLQEVSRGVKHQRRKRLVRGYTNSLERLEWKRIRSIPHTMPPALPCPLTDDNAGVEQVVRDLTDIKVKIVVVAAEDKPGSSLTTSLFIRQRFNIEEFCNALKI